MTLGQFVSTHPQAAPLLEQLRIDFCCGGHRDLDQVLRDQGLDPRTFETMVQAISSAKAPVTQGSSGGNPADLPVPGLIDHIVDRHHRYLRDQLPVLKAQAGKVAQAHGDKDPGLTDLSHDVCELAEELLEHLGQEEDFLFPRLLAGEAPQAGLWDSLREEHEDAGALLVRIRAWAQDFRVPDWGCATYRSLMEGLRALEEDLHLHINLENNVLFPKAQEP